MLVGVSHRLTQSTKVHVDWEEEMSALKKTNVGGVVIHGSMDLCNVECCRRHGQCFSLQVLEPILVAAFHQTRLDTRSMTQRSLKVGIRGRGGQAGAKAQALVTMMYLAHLKMAQLKLCESHMLFFLVQEVKRRHREEGVAVTCRSRWD